MKALLDTHTFLWWITNDPQLSAQARNIIANSSNDIFLSAASGWEIAIKTQIGKLPLADPPEQFVSKHLSLNAFQIENLPILTRDSKIAQYSVKVIW